MRVVVSYSQNNLKLFETVFSEDTRIQGAHEMLLVYIYKIIFIFRVVLAACSELLGTLLGAHEAQGEPVLVIDGADPQHVRALLDYMYTGEMNVHHVSILL